MKEIKSLVTVCMPNGEKISGIYIGAPDDFKRTFYQYKLHPKSQQFGINLHLQYGDGGFIRVPVDVLNNSLLTVVPFDEEKEVMNDR